MGEHARLSARPHLTLALVTAAAACGDGASTPQGEAAMAGAAATGVAGGGGAPSADAGAQAAAGAGAGGSGGAAVVGVAGAGGRVSAQDGGAAGEDSSGEPITCNLGCTPIFAHPIDAARGCVMGRAGAAPEWAVACECGGAAQMGVQCLSRRSDASAWVFVNAAIVDDEAWQPCSREQEAAALSPCNFLHCETPPASLCTLAATCLLRDCGGSEYDEQGCLRPTCTADVDCPPGTTCVTGCSTNAPCYSLRGNCQCLAPPSGTRCAEVSTCSPLPPPATP